MNLTHDESRALAFVAGLLLLSAAVRIAALPEPVEVPTGAALDLDAHIAATAAAVEEEERRARPLGAGERIDPNTATAADLDRLPGVGPSLADRIVTGRQDGRFRSVEDLTRVSGIGPRTADRLAPHLTLPRSGGGAGTGAGRTDGRTRARPIDVNTADAEALRALPGVGPVLAARIVAYRDTAGPFPVVDSLLAIPGIGPAKLERLRGLVRVR